MRPLHHSGFTLVETLVAVFIFGGALLSFGALSLLMQNASMLRYERTALSIAETKIEEVRNAGYASTSASGTFGSPLLASLPGGEASTTVSDYNAKTKLVVVGVSWEARDTSRYLALTTLITEIGGL